MTDERLTTLPLLASITLTGAVMATVIAWQATGVLMIALIPVPWLIVMIFLVPPVLHSNGRDAPEQLLGRRRTVAVGVATVAVIATLATASGWADAADADADADRTASAVLVLPAESTVMADVICDVTIPAVNANRNR